MFKRLINYIRESFGELKKVTWPRKDEVVMSTVLIIVFVILVALFLGFVDVLGSLGIREILTF